MGIITKSPRNVGLTLFAIHFLVGGSAGVFFIVGKDFLRVGTSNGKVLVG